VLGLARTRDPIQRGLQSGHVSLVVGDQTSQKRRTSGNRVASRLDPCRDRIGHSRLAGAI